MKDSSEALVRILTSEDPLKSVESQTQDLQLDTNVIHPVAYISGSFSQSQYRWAAISKECFHFLYVHQKVFPLFTKHQFASMLRSQAIAQNFHRTY